jgi:hypothetical protein
MYSATISYYTKPPPVLSATTASTFGNPRRQHRGGYPQMGILIDNIISYYTKPPPVLSIQKKLRWVILRRRSSSNVFSNIISYYTKPPPVLSIRKKL